MKKLLAIIMLTCCINAYAQTPEKKQPLFKLDGISIYDGRTYYNGFGFSEPQDIKGIIKGTSPLADVVVDLPKYGFGNNYWAQSDNSFAVGLHANFMLNPERVKNKSNGRHMFNVGLWYGNFGYADYSINGYSAMYKETVFMGNVPLDIDTVHYQQFYFETTYNTLTADLNYQYSSNPMSKVSISAGFGIGLGSTFANDYYGTFEEGYRNYLHPHQNSFAYTPWFLFTNDAVIIDENKITQMDDEGAARPAFVFRPYIPITLSYRLSKKINFLNHLTAFCMVKGGIEYLMWKGTVARSLFHERSIGLKYTL